jgi:hypothetical protein
MMLTPTVGAFTVICDRCSRRRETGSASWRGQLLLEMQRKTT